MAICNYTFQSNWSWRPKDFRVSNFRKILSLAIVPKEYKNVIKHKIIAWIGQEIVNMNYNIYVSLLPIFSISNIFQIYSPHKGVLIRIENITNGRVSPRFPALNQLPYNLTNFPVWSFSSQAHYLFGKENGCLGQLLLCDVLPELQQRQLKQKKCHMFYSFFLPAFYLVLLIQRLLQKCMPGWKSKTKLLLQQNCSLHFDYLLLRVGIIGQFDHQISMSTNKETGKGQKLQILQAYHHPTQICILIIGEHLIEHQYAMESSFWLEGQFMGKLYQPQDEKFSHLVIYGQIGGDL